MLEIVTNRVDGKTRRVDLHAVRVPGLNVKATELSGPDLYKAAKKLGVAGVEPSHGWQDICLRLAVHLQQQIEATNGA